MAARWGGGDGTHLCSRRNGRHSCWQRASRRWSARLSTPMLRRWLRIGCPRAGRRMVLLEAKGLVGAAEGLGTHEAPAEDETEPVSNLYATGYRYRPRHTECWNRRTGG